MVDNRTLTHVLRRTTEAVKESSKVAARSRKTVLQTAFILNRSRQLLAEWPIDGTPELRVIEREESTRRGGIGENSVGQRVTASRADAETAVEEVVQKSFAGETVKLDGKHFIDCKMEACILDYGGGPVVLESTQFTGCRFRFYGEAAMTVSVLECFGLIEHHTAELETPQLQNRSPGRVN